MTKKAQSEVTSEIAASFIDAMDYIKMRYYATRNNYRLRRSMIKTAETNNGISLTSPNLAFSNREIINRFASGIPIKMLMVPSYETDGSVEAEDIFSLETYNRMDHEEKQAFRESILQKKHNAETALKQAAQKQIDARRASERQIWLDNQIKLRDEAIKKGSQNKPDEPKSTN